MTNETIMSKLGEKVKAVYLSIGEYKIPELNDGVLVKYRPMFKFDNDSIYQGEWSGEGENSKRHG